MDALGPVGLVGLVLLFSLAVAVVVGGIMTHVGEREGFRESLRSLDEVYQFVALRDQELLVPFKDRVLGPVIEKMAGVGGKYAPGATSSPCGRSSSAPASSTPPRPTASSA